MHNTPLENDGHMKREEIDMEELNALLGLDDDKFENKFMEVITSP